MINAEGFADPLGGFRKVLRDYPGPDRANSAACLEHVLKAGPSCLTALTIGTVPT